MRRECARWILAYANLHFLLILIIQSVDGYPYINEDPDTSSFEGTEWSDDSEQSSERHMATGSYYGSTNGQNLNSTRRGTRNEEDIDKLIKNAFDNGELLDSMEWNGNRRTGPNRSVQRDTSRFQSSNSRTIDRRRSEGQAGQRRLFGNQGDSKEMMQSDGGIIFPNDDMQNTRPKPNFTRVPTCSGSTFCENVTSYPTEIVREAIERNASLRFLAAVDVFTDIAQRIDAPEEVALCVATERVVYPKTAENDNNQWLFIVNNPDFKQGVRVETCSNEDADCKMYDVLPEGYKSSCKQKYIYRQLVAVSEEGNVGPGTFRFPSSCCCHVKFTGNPMTRMGIQERNSQTTPIKRRRRK